MDSLDNNIKNENKIPGSPGCDSFTRPEEISALSKFLGNIKRNQEQNLNLNDSLEDIPGKTTGLFPEIKNLNEDYIKLSSGEQSKITELGNTFVPLDAPVFDEEVDSLPQHLIGLNTKNFELELDNELITLEDKRSLKLENSKEELEVNDKIKTLEKEKVNLKVSKVDKLEKTKLKLSDTQKTKTLEDTVINLSGNLIDPKLSEEKLNLLMEEKKISLDDTKILIDNNVNEVEMLENTLIDLKLDNDVTLEEDLVKLNIGKNEPNLEKEKIKLEIEEDNIDILPEIRDDLVIGESIKSLDNNIVDLVKDDLFNSDPELDETRVDIVNPKIIDNLDKSKINLLNTETETELRDQLVELVKENTNPDKLEGSVVDLILPNTKTELKESIIKLNNEEEKIKLENTKLELETSSFTKKQLDKSIVILNTDKTSSIELEKDVVKLRKDNTETALDESIVKLNNVKNLDNLEETALKLDNIDEVSELDNILVGLDDVNVTNELSNTVVTIESKDITELNDAVELLSNTESKTILSLEDYIDELGDSLSPVNQSNHSWFDNTESSKEKLIYTEKDRVDLSTTISDDDLPLLSRTDKDKDHDWVDNRIDDSDNPETLNITRIKSKQKTERIDTDLSDDIIPRLNSDYDWFDNRVDDSGNSINETKDTLDSAKEKLLLGTSKLSGEDEVTNPDWFDNTSDSKEKLIYTEKDRVDLSTTISDNDLPLLSQTKKKKDHDWIDNRVNNSGSPKTLNQATLESKESRKDIDTDLSDNIIPSLNSDYDWFDNTSDSNENLIYTEDDRVDLSTTISDNDLPLLSRADKDKDHDWIDNRVNDNGSPETLNQTTLNSKQKTERIDTDLSDNIIPDPESNYTWLNNSNTDDIDFELGDSYLEMKSPVTDQSEYTISDQDIPKLPTAGEDSYKYKYSNLGRIDVDNNLHYKYVKSLGEIDLYNEILNFKYSFIPPSVIGIKEGSRDGTRLDKGLDTKYDRFGKDPEVLEPEWLLFIKAITTAYLRPGEDEKIDLTKLESFKESILSLIRSNKVLKEKGLLKIKTPTKVSYNDGENLKSELDYGNDKGISLDLIPEKNRGEDYDWFDNTSDSKENLIYTEKDRVDLSTTISDSDLPLLSQTDKDKDHDWFDNRVDDSGNSINETKDTLDSTKEKLLLGTSKLSGEDEVTNPDWFNNRDSSGEELPNYMKHGPRSKLPEFNLSLDLLSRNFSISNFLRYGAENTVGAAFDLLFKEDKFEWHTPILKEARRKLLEETLAALIAGRDALEKVTKSQRHRLPGDDNHLGVLGDFVSGDFSAKGLVKNLIGEFISPETDKPTNRPQEITKEWKSYSMRPGEGIYIKDEEDEVVDVNGILEYKSHYLQGLGIETTFTELMNKSCADISSVEEFYNLLKTSPYFTTSNKVTTTESGYKVMTLDSNAHWEIILEPYIGKLNNWYTFLPLMEEINIRNGKLHGVKTGYNHWIPITSFELQKERLTSRSLGLFNGEIIFPISMEFSNEFRITIADDQYKSWRTYFERCAQASVYSSTPTIKDDITGEVSIKNRKTQLITIDKKYHLVAPYKNITFRCKILVMTPQLSTINRYDLLLTLKDISEERSGEIDSSGTDLSLGFSIVGENPGDELSSSERTARFGKTTDNKSSTSKKINTWRWRDYGEGKGNITGSILNSRLSIL